MSKARVIRHSLAKTGLRQPLVWSRHRGFNANDVFIGSYPRSGSTWLRFLLVEALAGQSSGFKNVNELIPDVGDHGNAQAILPGGGRVIKTHETYRASYQRAICLVRDPRDVVLSEYAYQKALGLAGDDFDGYVTAFLRDGVNPFGTWTNHVRGWLDAAQKQPAQILVVRYEDLRQQTPKMLAKLMDFFGKKVDEAAILKAIENNSLERMQAKEKVAPQRASAKGKFIRSGSVKGWKEKLSVSQLERIQEYAGEAMLRLGYDAAVEAGEEANTVRA